MTYLALVAGWTLTVLGFLTYLRTLVRPYQRREDVWADRVMHLAGRQWGPPPEPSPLQEPDLEVYSVAPEQDEPY